MKKIIIISLFLIFNSVAFAHSPVKSIKPKNNEVLNVAPTQIVLMFKSNAKLLKINLTKETDVKDKSLLETIFPKKNLEDIPLSDDSLMKNTLDHFISIPKLMSGSYLFKWRAMSEDGHVIKGKSKFKIN